TASERLREGSHAVASEQAHNAHVLSHAASYEFAVANYHSAAVANGVTHHPHVDTGSVSHVLKRLSDSSSAVADIKADDPHVYVYNVCHVLKHATNSLGAVGNSANTLFNAACDSSKALGYVTSEEVDLVKRYERSGTHGSSHAVVHTLKDLI